MAPPMAPPMAPGAPAAPSMGAYAASKGFLRSASTIPKVAAAVNPTDALLEAIRNGPKLRKAADRDSVGSGSGSLKSPLAARSPQVDMMAQLSQALAGRRKDLAPTSTTSSSSGSGPALPAKKFTLPKAAAPEPPKEVVWD
jgi:hypothetical protein